MIEKLCKVNRDRIAVLQCIAVFTLHNPELYITTASCASNQ